MKSARLSSHLVKSRLKTGSDSSVEVNNLSKIPSIPNLKLQFLNGEVESNLISRKLILQIPTSQITLKLSISHNPIYFFRFLSVLAFEINIKIIVRKINYRFRKQFGELWVGVIKTRTSGGGQAFSFPS